MSGCVPVLAFPLVSIGSQLVSGRSEQGMPEPARGLLLPHVAPPLMMAQPPEPLRAAEEAAAIAAAVKQKNTPRMWTLLQAAPGCMRRSARV